MHTLPIYLVPTKVLHLLTTCIVTTDISSNPVCTYIHVYVLDSMYNTYYIILYYMHAYVYIDIYLFLWCAVTLRILLEWLNGSCMWKRAAEARKCVCSPWELSKYLITLCVVVPTSHGFQKFFKCLVVVVG
jgi:hypothetical protein